MATPYVTLIAVWGNDDVIVELLLLKREWLEIQNGEKFVGKRTYYYEAERYTSYWLFNFPTRGKIQIDYGDEGATGFIGDIENLRIVFKSPRALAK
jgi:hypothetical protein